MTVGHFECLERSTSSFSVRRHALPVNQGRDTILQAIRHFEIVAHESTQSGIKVRDHSLGPFQFAINAGGRRNVGLCCQLLAFEQTKAEVARARGHFINNLPCQKTIPASRPSWFPVRNCVWGLELDHQQNAFCQRIPVSSRTGAASCCPICLFDLPVRSGRLTCRPPSLTHN